MSAKDAKLRSERKGPATEREMECFQRVLHLLEGKWKREILWQLSWGTKRFGELRRLLPGISQHMLTRRLRELEAAGMVTRNVYAEVPPRVEYSITKATADLSHMFDALLIWAEKYETHLNGSGSTLPSIDAS